MDERLRQARRLKELSQDLRDLDVPPGGHGYEGSSKKSEESH